jgi:hypothetical protein
LTTRPIAAKPNARPSSHKRNDHDYFGQTGKHNDFCYGTAWQECQEVPYGLSAGVQKENSTRVQKEKVQRE